MTTPEQSIRLATDSGLNVIHTCLPGVILTYDHETQKATVQPSLRKVYQTKDAQGNNLVQNMPVLNAVPVIFQRSGTTSISFPLKPGDRVLVLVSERSLDEWIASTENQVTPQDPRKFHLSDATCIPGLYPFSDPLPLENNQDFVIKHEGSSITIKGDGEVDIKTSSKVAIGTSTNEVLKIISDLLDSLSTSITTPIGDPIQGALPALTYSNLKAQIEAIRGTIT